MKTSHPISNYMYIFYGFVVIFHLLQCPGIYEIDYFTSFFGGSCIYKKEENAQRFMYNAIMIVCDPAHADDNQQRVYDEKW